MRVVAGSARGRKLAIPPGDRVRPTTDRVREAVCNALDSMGAIIGARVVDLFAGSGALAIEALSRGASDAVFVEPDGGTRQVIEANLAVLGPPPPRVTVVAATAQDHLTRVGSQAYDLAFADPPYAFDDWPALWEAIDPAMAADAVVVIESDRDIHPYPGWDVVRSRRYGSTVVAFYARSPNPQPASGVQA